MPGITTIVDTARYPIHDPSSDGYRTMVSDAGRHLAAEGIVCLEGFLSEAGLRAAQNESSDLEASCYRRSSSLTVYFGEPDPAYPADHPLRRTELTAKASAARHQMKRGGVLKSLYEWEPLRRLIADLLGYEKLYLHEDPSNALVINYYRPGERIGWHFDRARFATTIMLNEAERGGEFEFFTNIRSDDDPNYNRVASALDGDIKPQSTAAPDGTLVIFKGRNSLHRIRPVEGSKTRHLLIMHFEEQPGIRLPEHFRKLFFGPDAPGD